MQATLKIIVQPFYHFDLWGYISPIKNRESFHGSRFEVDLLSMEARGSFYGSRYITMKVGKCTSMEVDSLRGRKITSMGVGGSFHGSR